MGPAPPDRGYGVTPDGQAVAVQGPPLEAADAFFNYAGGDQPGHFAPSTPEFQFQKVITASDGTTSTVPLIGIANQQAESVQVTSKSKFKVQLSLEKDPGATGAATFADGTTTMTVTTPATVQIKGLNPSATADDLRLAAKIAHHPVSMQKFSVVSVALTIKTSGSLSPHNTAIDAYLSTIVPLGGFSDPSFQGLGAFVTGNSDACRIGVQFTGMVTPRNYQGKVILRRNLLPGALYDEAGVMIDQFPDATHPANDTSDIHLRDDDPQANDSGGNVYDIDSPSVNLILLNQIRRFRTNFSEFAVLDQADNEARASSNFNWFARVSCRGTDQGPMLDTSVIGDNQAGQGLTALTITLQ